MNLETSIENIDTTKDITKTSLSNQGYAIYKNKITEKEVENIKNDLTIKPFSCPGYGNPEDIEPYKIYKEKQENYKKTQILKVSIEKIFKLADF